ncbi:MAG: cation:proton antiporter [Candidatus Brocadiaceae bacterium]|nr:cation:proton antiporter [Candidatus Brocadiaceae bacterium]
MPISLDIFSEIALLLAIAVAAGALALWLRQPLIMAFIAVGILAGPSGLDWVHSHDQIDLFAKLGIALLLFVVGLKLDPHMVRAMGLVALATGLGQVLFTSLIGYFIALGLGLPTVSALYVAIALTFSSTIIIVKLLSDKRELDSLHGRIAIGLLIVQDFVVILAIIGLSAFVTRGTGNSLGSNLLMVMLKGSAFLAMIGLLMRYVFPVLMGKLARSQELLVLFAIAWAAAMASLGNFLGFSMEVGAILAGVALASTSYRNVIGARLVSLRDFLLLFFFIDLGSQLELSLLGAQLWSAIILSLFVLIGNPLIVMVILGFMGYRKRTGFLVGLTVAQISEFSLLLGALGLSMGHINANILGLITLVGLVTIGLSTYMIKYSHLLYEWLTPWLGIFERTMHHPEDSISAEERKNASPVEVIVFGLGRYGGNVVRELQKRGVRVLGIDFDPEAVTYWREEGLPTFYGDVEDPEFPYALPLSEARWVVSTVLGQEACLTLLHNLRHHGFKGRIALTSHTMKHVISLKQAGADVVLLPFHDAAAEAVDRMMEPTNADPA